MALEQQLIDHFNEQVALHGFKIFMQTTKSLPAESNIVIGCSCRVSVQDVVPNPYLYKYYTITLDMNRSYYNLCIYHGLVLQRTLTYFVGESFNHVAGNTTTILFLKSVIVFLNSLDKTYIEDWTNFQDSWENILHTIHRQHKINGIISD